MNGFLIKAQGRRVVTHGVVAPSNEGQSARAGSAGFYSLLALSNDFLIYFVRAFLIIPAKQRVGKPFPEPYVISLIVMGCIQGVSVKPSTVFTPAAPLLLVARFQVLDGPCEKA